MQFTFFYEFPSEKGKERMISLPLEEEYAVYVFFYIFPCEIITLCKKSMEIKKVGVWSLQTRNPYRPPHEFYKKGSFL